MTRYGHSDMQYGAAERLTARWSKRGDREGQSTG